MAALSFYETVTWFIIYWCRQTQGHDIVSLCLHKIYKEINVNFDRYTLKGHSLVPVNVKQRETVPFFLELELLRFFYG
jgi:hypothetical protein